MSIKEHNEHLKMKTFKAASRLKLLSFNPNSIGRNPKRSEIFHFLRDKKADIIFLSDTRLSKDVESAVKQEWGGKAYFASHTSQARGVAVLISKDLPLDIYEETLYRDPSGNIIMFNCKFENCILSLCCLYGLNNDNPQFYEDILFPQIENLQTYSSLVVIGMSL